MSYNHNLSSTSMWLWAKIWSIYEENSGVLWQSLIILLKWLKQPLGTETSRFYPTEGQILHSLWDRESWVISIKSSKWAEHLPIGQEAWGFTATCPVCSYGLQLEGCRSSIHCHYCPCMLEKYTSMQENMFLALRRLQIFCKCRKANIRSDLRHGMFFGGNKKEWALPKVYRFYKFQMLE